MLETTVSHCEVVVRSHVLRLSRNATRGGATRRGLLIKCVQGGPVNPRAWQELVTFEVDPVMCWVVEIVRGGGRLAKKTTSNIL